MASDKSDLAKELCTSVQYHQHCANSGGIMTFKKYLDAAVGILTPVIFLFLFFLQTGFLLKQRNIIS